MPLSNYHRRGHIVSPPPGRYLVYRELCCYQAAVRARNAMMRPIATDVALCLCVCVSVGHNHKLCRVEC